MAATTATGTVSAPVGGPVRSGRRTKHLVKRLQPGEVALIDHADLDRVSAEDLIAAGAVAVLNCRPSSSLDYPNMGPALLAEAGIPLVDLPDDTLFDTCRDGILEKFLDLGKLMQVENMNRQELPPTILFQIY